MTAPPPSGDGPTPVPGSGLDALRQVLAHLPSLALIDSPSPVTRHDSGGRVFLAKRDDRLAPLAGGTKPRKLDTLLATEPFVQAKVWHTVGAIGSGHVVACVAAAEKLNRQLVAHLFWEPLSGNVLENLAFTASRAHALHFYRSRVHLALRHPRLLLQKGNAREAIIPPGAWSVEGTLGVVAAALEFADQVARGELECPDAVFVPVGTGGTLAGLAIGFALAALPTRLVGVAVVERVFLDPRRLARHMRQVVQALKADGASWPTERQKFHYELLHTYLGKGYADPTAAAVAACETARHAGLSLEPVYSGKAMAALLDALASGRVTRPLLWCTPHAPGLEPKGPWHERLPSWVRHRIEQPSEQSMRRKVLFGLGATGLALGAGIRFSGYRTVLDTVTLRPWEHEVLRAATLALFPDATPSELEQAGREIDGYVAGLPKALQLELHGAFLLVEHGTVLGLEAWRFTRLSPNARLAVLLRLARYGSLIALAARGIRDLCLFGMYQQPSRWPELGYDGPMVGLGVTLPRLAKYEALRATKDQRPRSAR